MYTQCPHCQTCFRIAEAHLKVANGKVRCGSCQEVFDATQHLFKNLTDREPITDFNQPASPPPPRVSPKPSPSTREPITDAQRRPTPPASPKPRPTASDHIDLSSRPATPEQTLEEVRRERAKTPDQGHFMESVVGNDRYNDLDQMGAISIPGEIDFGDSFIKFPEDKKEDSPATKPADSDNQRTPYEDLESKETAATTADHDSIRDFYAQVDAQLGKDEDLDSRSQLDKDIDELLAFAKGLDLDDQPTLAEQTKPAASEDQQPQQTANEFEEFDLQAIADFEKELDATSTGVFAAQELQAEPSGSKAVATDKAATKDNKPDAPVEAKSHPAMEVELPSANESADTHQAEQFTADELPSADEDIPLALRRSLDSLNQLPQRSLGQTLLLLLVIVVLIAGLGFQMVIFHSVELAHKFPNLIPVLNKVCNQVPCRYSGRVDVSQIKLISRDVRSDPKQPNALLISATFVDQAPFDQPYPNILITLYDLGGNVVASRRFTPQEYLESMYNRFLLMESGTPVRITLAVLDPGKDAINFEFSFQ